MEHETKFKSILENNINNNFNKINNYFFIQKVKIL